MREIIQLKDKILEGKEISFEEAVSLINVQGADIFDLLSCANRIRENFKGSYVKLCAFLNARSGRCSEDCAFCSQSKFHKTAIEVYPMLSPEAILSKAREAYKMGAEYFSIVTSGRGLGSKDLDKACAAIKLISQEASVFPCASLGIISEEMAMRLKEAGLVFLHHNLETARSFFNRICTTHSYEERVATIKNAKSVGLKTCCGGVFGLGESVEQRVELLFTLKELGVDSVAINFLIPIEGAKLGDASYLTPIECLKIIAVCRFILPSQDIMVCGGREINLRELQSLMFVAGANGTALGDYLTTKGRDSHQDIQLVRDMELEGSNQIFFKNVRYRQ